MARRPGKEFVSLTMSHHIEQTDQQNGIAPPPLFHKHPDAGPAISLPDPAGLVLQPLDFARLVSNRKSLRKYTDTPLGLDELSFLLWCTQGVKEMRGEYALFRTVPSAGARHPIDTYLAVNRVTGCAPGLYQFLPKEFAISPVIPGEDFGRRVSNACFGQPMPAASAVTFIWTAVPYRTTWRYGQRGYRYIYLDAGHICQNLYLAAEAVGAGCCAMGAYDDRTMNDLLGVDGENEFVIYLASVGKKEKT